MSILEQLYNGKIYPCESIFPQSRSEYCTVSEKVGNDYEYFMKTLPTEQAGRFKEMDKNRTKLSNMQAYANFEYGFKLGAMLIGEILSYQKLEE